MTFEPQKQLIAIDATPTCHCSTAAPDSKLAGISTSLCDVDQQRRRSGTSTTSLTFMLDISIQLVMLGVEL